MMNFQIQPNTRRCCVTGSELRPGERYYSVLVDEAGKFVRRDFSEQAWQGPPAEAFGFWAGKVSASPGPRRQPIDDEMLLDCFRRLEGQTDPARLNFRFVVALLLTRRRRLKFEEAVQEDGREVLCLRCARTGTRHRVVNPNLTEEETAAVQEQVFEALGWE
jgi:hypothetical protein